MMQGPLSHEVPIPPAPLDEETPSQLRGRITEYMPRLMKNVNTRASGKITRHELSQPNISPTSQNGSGSARAMLAAAANVSRRFLVIPMMIKPPTDFS